MQPESRLRARTRLYLQRALTPPAFFSAIEHARRFQGNPVERMKQAAWWKAQGVLPGLSDVMIWDTGRHCGIELKVRGNKATPAEIAFGQAMHRNGFHWFVAYSVLEVDTTLRALGYDILPSMRVLAMNYDAALSVPEPAKKRSSQRWSEEDVADAGRKRLDEFLGELP